MLKSSLLEIIRTFSNKELVKFEDLVRSPYFNKKENTIKLFLEIKKYSPDLSDTKLEKEKVWLILFPGAEYNYGIMKNLIFDLNKLAVKFIELENYSEKKFDSDINILEQYLARRILHNFEKKITDIKNYLSKGKITSDLYFNKFKLGMIEILYLNTNTNIKDILKFDHNETIHNLNLFFFLKHFEVNSDLMISKFYYNKNSDDKFRQNINDLYLKYDHKNYYSEMYYYLFKCSSDYVNADNYYALKKLYFENFDKLTREDQSMFADALIIYCLKKSSHGSQEFVKERFQYHKIKDDHDLLSFQNKDKIVDGYMILNTIIAACNAGEFDWSEQFLEKHRSELEPDNKDKIVNLAYTHINFKRKNFEKALDYLSKCGNPTGMDKINLKTYQILLYYDLKYFDELKNLIDTCRHFLRNDKSIAGDVKLVFGKFIEAVNKLNEYRYKKDRNSADESVFREIKNFITDGEIIHLGWLNNKLSEMEIK